MTFHDAEAADNTTSGENAGEDKGDRRGDKHRSAPTSVLHMGSSLNHNLFCYGSPGQVGEIFDESYTIVWMEGSLGFGETPPNI
jgi:hypothetical protein